MTKKSVASVTVWSEIPADITGALLSKWAMLADMVERAMALGEKEILFWRIYLSGEGREKSHYEGQPDRVIPPRALVEVDLCTQGYSPKDAWSSATFKEGLATTTYYHNITITTDATSVKSAGAFENEELMKEIVKALKPNA